MPVAAFAHFHNYGPATAALVCESGVGTMQDATPVQAVRAGIAADGVGEVGAMRPYRCRNAAIDVSGIGSVQIAPKRYIRTGLSVAVNALTASDVEGALQNMKIEGGISFVQAMRAVLAVLAGNATGLEGGSPAFKSQDGTTNRVTANYTGGNRTITAIDLD